MSDDVLNQLRLLGEVLERQALPVDIEEVTARKRVVHAAEIAPAARRWSAARWVGTAAGVVAVVGVAAVVLAALRPAPTPPGPTSGGDPTPSLSVKPAPAPDSDERETSTPPEATDRVAGLFAPTSVPDGFQVSEAITWRGSEPDVSPQVSAERWITRDDAGAVTDVVRLTANEKPPPPPNLVPLDPTGLTVHGELAQSVEMGTAGGGSGISWDEQGLTLFVTSWGPDAAAIAERTIVTASDGITLPDGALPAEFSRVDTQAKPSLASGLASMLAFATSDGTARLALSSRPNASGETSDSLGLTPGAQRRTVGDRQVWLSTSEDGSARASWIEGDYILSAGGVDETTLIAFVSTVEPASAAEFDRFVVSASVADEALAEHDRATFADGLIVSMRSISDINVPEVSSFGRRAFCVTGDRTLCTGASPSTDDGLLARVTSTRTIDQAREFFAWTRAGHTVSRIYDPTTDVDLSFETAAGTAGSFVRAKAPPEITAIAVEYEASPGMFGARQAELDLLDEYANVNVPVLAGG